MISVLVCTYNQEKYLAQALDSVLMQQCDEPFEILIGDDCSTDSTSQIADDYQSRFPEIIRVIRPEKNKGASQNIVRLVNEAKGEYLSICDGDDYWLCEEILQKQIGIFRTAPSVGMVCAKAKRFIQSKGNYEGSLGYVGAEDLMTMLYDNQDVAAPTIAFRTELMKQCVAESKWYIDNN
jgi:glycosyltransferase involved in cell wall biosynthesis